MAFDFNVAYDRLIGMGVAPQMAGQIVQQMGQQVRPADPETTGSIGGGMPTNLPLPATSPQFQGTTQTGGPALVNTVPRLPGETQEPNNISNPAMTNSSGGGAAFGDVFANNPMPVQPRPFSTDDVPATTGSTTRAPVASGAPTAAYASAPSVGGPGAEKPAGALTPSFWTDQQGNFLGIGNYSDIGKRLERVGGWLNPQGASGMAAAAGAQNGDRNAATNEMVAKNNIALSNRKLDLLERPSPNAFDSDNGRFRIVETTDPRTGKITRERMPIPEDEQNPAKVAAGFKPSATVEKMLREDEDQSQKNLGILNEAKELRQMFRDNRIDMSLVGQTEAQLRGMAQSDGPEGERARNALRAKAFISAAANNQLRSEKGVQTDSDAKRIQDEILNGTARYNNKAIYDWMGKHMDQVKTDVQYRSRRAQTAIKRYGAGYDPDGYMAQDWQNRQTTSQGVYDADSQAEKASPYSGVTAPAPAAGGHIDPVIADYQRRMGIR